MTLIEFIKIKFISRAAVKEATNFLRFLSGQCLKDWRTAELVKSGYEGYLSMASVVMISNERPIRNVLTMMPLLYFLPIQTFNIEKL